MGKRICVLEDNEDIRTIIGLILEEEHYDVSAYANITEFLARNKSPLPDVFLLDVMLPDGNGLDVCRKLKADVSTHNIPVMMMSANYRAKEVPFDCDAQDFISKPFDIQDLINRIGIQARA